MSDRQPSRLKMLLELAIFAFLGCLFIMAGLFSGFSLSFPMQFILGLHASFMAGYGIVAPIVRTRKKQQVKEETDLIYWSFFCILFFIGGADMMVINATFGGIICGLSVWVNTAIIGVLVMATAYLAFVVYYARLRYKRGSV